MKKALLLLLVCSTFLCGKAQQITYFNYLDYTVEWSIYAGGWSGFYGYTVHTTCYFDGDTVLAGKTYYKGVILRLDTNYTTPIAVDTEQYMFFMREDSAGKIWRYVPNNGSEVNDYDWQQFIQLQPGDSYPLDTNCKVNYIDTVYLGNRALRRLKNNNGPPPFNSPNFDVEGIGHVGMLCGIGTEANSWKTCFRKQSDSLEFVANGCGEGFLKPVRTWAPTGVPNVRADKINVYPNPATNYLYFTTNGLSVQRVRIYNANGSLLAEQERPSNNSIDISSLTKGIYIAEIQAGNSIQRLRWVKI